VVIADHPVLLQISQKIQGNSAKLQVRAESVRITASDRPRLTAILDRLLGLRIDLTEFYAFAVRHPRLNELVLRLKGLKPPRFTSAFEGLVNGVACQQLSLEAGLSLLNRLSRASGYHMKTTAECSMHLLDPRSLHPPGSRLCEPWVSVETKRSPSNPSPDQYWRAPSIRNGFISSRIKRRSNNCGRSGESEGGLRSMCC